MQRVWGDDTHITPNGAVDTLVKRVRRKVEDESAKPRFILTVWGTGIQVRRCLNSRSGIAVSTGGLPSASSR